MSELLPCPFCGKRMNEENFFSCDGYPKACGCWETTHTAEEAMTVWNTRPIEYAMQAEIDRLIELQRKMPLVADRRGAELSDLRAQHTRLIDQCKRLADEICGYVGADGNAPGSAELSNFKHLMKELDV